MKLDKSVVQRRIDLMAAEGVVGSLRIILWLALTPLFLPTDIRPQHLRRQRHRRQHPSGGE